MATNKRLIKSNDEAAGGASFNTIIWDGEVGSGSRDFSGVGFQPDLVWVKRTSSGDDHHIYDSVRGAGSTKVLASNKTAGEPANNAATYGYLDAFLPDGFSTVSGSANNAFFNENAQSMVAWCWKAGGNSNTYNVDGVGYSTSAAAGISTTGSNVTLQGASINTETGFSIITFAGGGAYPKKVPHGLGVTPKITISFTRDVANDPIVMTTVVNGTEDYLILNSTATLITTTRSANSSIFDIIYSDNANYVSYCFAEIAGFSKFGSYAGTGASGNTVVTGFEPAFVMMKAYDDTSDWFIVDNKRNLTDPRNSNLRPNNSNAEANAASGLKFLENGFEFTGAAFNDNNVSWIYMAFANQF